jgi:hypothetical protein
MVSVVRWPRSTWATSLRIDTPNRAISIACAPPGKALDDRDSGHRRAGFDQRLDVPGQSVEPA